MTVTQPCAGLQWVLPAAHVGSVRCDRHWGHARREVKLDASLELGGEEEDGFPQLTGGGGEWEGFGVSLIPWVCSRCFQMLLWGSSPFL